jgi:hypothetical protein
MAALLTQYSTSGRPARGRAERPNAGRAARPMTFRDRGGQGPSIWAGRAVNGQCGRVGILWTTGWTGLPGQARHRLAGLAGSDASKGSVVVGAVDGDAALAGGDVGVAKQAQ